MGYGQYSYQSFYPRSLKDFRAGVPQDRQTGKRVKGVFDTSQTIHIWAQRSQTFGKNGKGNVYFEGDRLFDYGTHFCMGQFVTNKRGELACFLNADSHGPTTSHHQSITRGSIPEGIPVFTIPKAGYDNRKSNPEALDLDSIVESYRARAEKAALTYTRARSEWSKNYNAQEAARLADEARAFGVFFDAPVPSFDVAELADRAKVKEAEIKAAEKAREALARASSADRFAAWQRGESNYCPHEWANDEKGGTRLRVKGDMLQTARGAEVPLSHAIRVFRFIKKCRADNKDWHKNGTTIRVGHFQIDSINRNGDFKAGCHFITWAQVELAAKAAGVLDLAPADTRESSQAAA